MSIIENHESFLSGTLTLWDITCHYIYSQKSILKITPEKNAVESFSQKCKEQKGSFDKLDWIHGKTDDNYDVVFHPAEQQGPLNCYMGSLTLLIDVVLKTMNSTPDKESLYGYTDLNGFTAIDFIGNPVNAVFNPKIAINREKSEEKIITWRDPSEYAVAFDTEIEGVACKLFFTVTVERSDYNYKTTMLGSMNSILRVEFPCRQPPSMIETCWQSVCRFLAFCNGRFNVTNLEIRLWDTSHLIGPFPYAGLIQCQINDDKKEDIQELQDAFGRFQILSLNPKIGDLFKLINSNDTKPFLGFLPRNNYDLSVDSYKIRDLCTSIEAEDRLGQYSNSDEIVAPLIEELKKCVTKYKKENPGQLDDGTYSYISTTLQWISLPARKKAISLYSKYDTIIRDNYLRHLVGYLRINTEQAQTEADIGWLIKLRNNITHTADMTSTEIPNAIFARMRVAVYCSILERAGYSLAEISKIIDEYSTGIVHKIENSKEVG